MADRDDYKVGFGKPPQEKQFAKGQSGNPNGRPKGAKNLSTILHQVGRESVRVNVNGRQRLMSKYEASVHQLVNQAIRGDSKAIRELFYWTKVLVEPELCEPNLPVQDEKDKPVIENILRRLRRLAEAESTTDAAADPVCGKKED